jgi:monoamine oxidase
VLAGDYTYPDYPATLEGAVRSGREAAGLLIGR